MKYLTVAKIINTHGIKGEVKVLCNYYGNNYNNWKINQIFYLENNNDHQRLIINSVRPHKNYLLITFKNYNDINQVLFMKDKLLAIDNEMSNFDDLWIEQNLIGYQAINNEDQKKLGQITNLIDNNHTGLWEIIDENNKTHYVPNNKHFINKIDKVKKIVYFNLLLGMFNYE